MTLKSNAGIVLCIILITGLSFSCSRNNNTAEENNEEIDKSHLFSDLKDRVIELDDLESLKESCLAEYNKNFWLTADAEEYGLNKAALDRHLQFCKDTGADSVLVVYKGRIVQEWYANEKCKEPFNVQSITKSMTGLLTGMLIDDGELPSIDIPVSEYVSGWDVGDKSQVSIYNLLSMTAGFKRKWSEGLGSTNKKDAYAAGCTLEYKPGTVWEYSNEGAQLLSQILCQAAGQSIAVYAEERLFAPLGMKDTELRTDEMGCVWTYSGMETTARDLARIGILMINKGWWGEIQIVSEEWIEQSISPSQELYPWYGLLWWIIDDPAGVAGMGGYDNYFGIFPESELIVVRIQEAPKPGIEMYQYEGRAASYFLEFFK
jgi:CubicO group peptidase (beta-lactamase class C family)